MERRFVSIWFRYLTTDWFSLRQPHLRDLPFVLCAPSHGRMIVTAANAVAQAMEIDTGTAVADARAIIPTLQIADDKSDLGDRLLKRLAEWCIRFTPSVAVDSPDGLLLDVTGCTHLWGGDQFYLDEIIKKLNARGYDVRAAIADTAGAAWAVARYGNGPFVITSEFHIEALLPLPPEALRLEMDTIDRLHKLGLHRISQLIGMPRSSLRRRFGEHFIHRLNLALGLEEEVIQSVQPMEPYHVRLPCLEPIVTLTGIEIALDQVLKMLCHRLQQEQKGLRVATLKGYRVDGKVVHVDIGTHQPSHNVSHLFKLFENKLSTIEPALGIELFVLEASKIEDHTPKQEELWQKPGGLDDVSISELIDRLAGKTGVQAIRYLPDEHYWPERSFRPASSLNEKLKIAWRSDRPRPINILSVPERIEVTSPIPDYPPMLFRYQGKLHRIMKADGPERIEQEWWLQQGQHRDYYRVEDEEGQRYWLFRLGHYNDKTYQWFMHGFFA
ncbi:DNA polymerase Y family protein [Chryseolinea sp. H1M3-3]|uniref:Y-family DNA polymerase n=1 Tax=Chryseolinea sp. H1M3-3 TaxID=3034144 RepID=UPI0023EAD685|nr:DNA polymerase Y family protein [Chryseolinea sp. H1M3-3]